MKRKYLKKDKIWRKNLGKKGKKMQKNCRIVELNCGKNGLMNKKKWRKNLWQNG